MLETNFNGMMDDVSGLIHAVEDKSNHILEVAGEHPVKLLKYKNNDRAGNTGNRQCGAGCGKTGGKYTGSQHGIRAFKEQLR